MGSQFRHPSRDGVEKELRREFVKKPLINNKWGRLLEFESIGQDMPKHGLLRPWPKGVSRWTYPHKAAHVHSFFLIRNRFIRNRPSTR